MIVRNIEARLIRVGGEFISPNQEVEIADDAVGLDRLIERGVLIDVTPKAEDAKKDGKSKKQE
ncbi:hypothetical protein BV195_00020 [Haemophilus influenzae]|uniref:Uncharacterized protein n=1 Tax=Haemophilus influenzae TaxID=727 RepID=A0A2S9RQT4_HAEIF|nr:hypothetical protein [Haemophilus influenzae]PRI47005.1 hypothetical protein BVZ70_00312 [Haemophilus influenzae]PRJ63216.1 hypothetical protein BV102_00419 [Haemophilus influenzae]PRK14915.1 hypothetical protein BV195_00020 [Haemophilus influenzae]PRM16098.1 hypothetical protein BV011_00665 [Haemophilus influenzae]PRM42925.1 hypothetical protein BVZ69_00550 [Haemophilus influenzae]